MYIYKASESPRYPTGHYTNAGTLCFPLNPLELGLIVDIAFLVEGAVIVLILRRIYIKRNEALGDGETKWRL